MKLQTGMRVDDELWQLIGLFVAKRNGGKSHKESIRFFGFEYGANYF